MAGQFDIYFVGLKQDVREESAIAALAKLLKLGEKAAASIIHNSGRVIKSGLDREQAERYRQLLEQVGMQIEIQSPIAIGRNDAPAVPTEAEASPSTDDAARVTFDDSETREYPVRFHGKGLEYFKIWIVNILLSILTLGIYSAWAKVRNKQYFYGNTEIDGSSFQYTAKPIQILKGRIIAFLMFLAYTVLNQAFPPAALVLALLFMIFLPWIVIRSLAFNARNSMYRNIRFRFTGGGGEASVTFLVLPFLTMFTAGLLMPYVWYRQTRFYVTNHHFGTTGFEFDASISAYYKLFFKLVLLGILLFIPIGIISAMLGTGKPSNEIISLLLSLVMMLFYILMFAILKAGLGNLRFNNSRLEDAYFHSRLTTRGMASLYLVNTLAVVFSLGLMIPWAKVRTAAYRASCLTLIAPGLDGFIAAEEEKVSALGEQIGDLFDVDILGL